MVLTPVPAPAPELEIALTPPESVQLSWPLVAGARYLFEQSPDLQSWSELWPAPEASPLMISTNSPPRSFYRLLQSVPTNPPTNP